MRNREKIYTFYINDILKNTLISYKNEQDVSTNLTEQLYINRQDKAVKKWLLFHHTDVILTSTKFH